MLARLRHPNVCLFMGACFDEQAPHWALVTEYISQGESCGTRCAIRGAIEPGPSAEDTVYRRNRKGPRLPPRPPAARAPSRRQVAERLGGCGGRGEALRRRPGAERGPRRSSSARR